MGIICFPDDGKRCWVTVGLVGRPNRRGQQRRVTQRLIADTGCPAELILPDRVASGVSWYMAKGIDTNYGWLPGYAVRVEIPQLSFGRRVTAHASGTVARIARNEGFDGIAGKAFLDHFHWCNGAGGELCLETWESYGSRRAEDTGE